MLKFKKLIKNWWYGGLTEGERDVIKILILVVLLAVILNFPYVKIP